MLRPTRLSLVAAAPPAAATQGRSWPLPEGIAGGGRGRLGWWRLRSTGDARGSGGAR